MSDKKQTALQWYIQQHDELAELSRNKTITISEILIRIKDIKKQALQMEREQIVHAFLEGTKMIDINNELSARFNACVYYVETYGGQDEN